MSDSPFVLPDSDADLLALHVAVLDELKTRKITRSDNIPTGDYAELLVARHFDRKLESNSVRGYDVQLADGTRVQIKARRVDVKGKQGSFSPIRNLHECEYEDREFDVVIAIVFERDYAIREAWWIPWRVVKEHARYSGHTNGSRLGRITGALAAADGIRKLDLQQD